MMAQGMKSGRRTFTLRCLTLGLTLIQVYAWTREKHMNSLGCA